MRKKMNKAEILKALDDEFVKAKAAYADNEGMFGDYCFLSGYITALDFAMQLVEGDDDEQNT